MDDAVKAARRGFRALAAGFASLGFVIMVIGITYFAMLVMVVAWQEGAKRAAAYYELGKFLSGGLAWYQNAGYYGAASLLCALTSLLFGVHRLARITIPVAGTIYFVLLFYGDEIGDTIARWAAGS